MRKFTYPAPFPCEVEWTSRSLEALAAHLNQRYRQPTRRRLEAIQSRLQEITPSGHARRAAHKRLAEAFSSLAETLDEHVWLEDEILCPAIVGVEHDPDSSDVGARKALCQLITTVKDEHRRLRRMVDALGHAIGEVTGLPLPVDEAELASDLEMLAMLLHEQVDLEDRCLWPRALALLQRQP
jgi:iron-sulfur cluster repair protein YtfE (RIC family)